MKLNVKAALVVSLLGSVWPFASAMAETGVTDKEILIGTSSMQSGPSQFYGIKTNIGVNAYFNALNEQGGIFGRKIKVISEDDKYEANEAIQCFNRLKTQGVFAVTGLVGSPTAAKYLPMAENYKIPAVGFYSGPLFVADPVKHYCFTDRAPYRDEMKETIDHLWSQSGARKFGVVYQNDSFGADELDGVKSALKEHHVEVVAAGSYTRNQNNIEEAFNKVKDAAPDVVILAAVYKPCEDVVKLANKANWHPIFVMNTGSCIDAFIGDLGQAAEGMIFTQTSPPPSATAPAVVEYTKAMKKYFPQEKLSYISLMGYMDAMVIAEGLKRAGRDLTRDGFVQSLESIRKVDVGLGKGMELTYSPTDHLGFHKVFFAIVKNGQAVNFTDWAALKQTIAKK